MSDFERRMKEAEERAEQDIAEGIVREPLSAFRVEMEQKLLSERKGLSKAESRATLAEFIRGKNMTVRDFQRLPNREKLDLIREAFAA